MVDNYKIHPVADLFPLIEGQAFDELVASIEENGLREDIVLAPDGETVVDGRNRLRACLEARVDPRFRTLGSNYDDAKVVKFIVDTNLRRRDLNPGQKAFLALEIEAYFAEAAKKRQAHGQTAPGKTKETLVADPPQASDKSREQAARTTGASGKGVQMAKKVAAVAPDLKDRVMAGTVSLDAAYKQAQEIEKERDKREAPPETDKTKTPPVTIVLKTHDGTDVIYSKPKGKVQFNATSGDGISWASWSWNPVTGCLRNCAYCYAREIAHDERMKAVYPVGFTPLFHHERLECPANTPVPVGADKDPSLLRVFVCSMADLYGGWVPDEWVDAVHQSCANNSQWQYIHLTKNPSRYVVKPPPAGGWIGASVDEQKMVRIAEEAMARVEGAAVRWLSIEPMKEELRFNDLSMFDWIVIGAQTETHQPTGLVPAFAPPFEWVARIVAQAREAGCKVHLKPNLLGKVSGSSPGMQLPNEYPVSRATKVKRKAS
jgi:protein gp37/ParB-like chromosome segregation protein Spo0J